MKTFNCSEISLTISETNIKVKKLPSIHVLGDWTDRHNKSGSALSQSEEKMVTDIMTARGFEQLVHFPTQENKHWI